MEIIIPVIDSTLPFCLKYVVPALLKFIEGGQVILLGKGELKKKISDPNIRLEDEDCIFPEMTLKRLKDVIKERGGLASRTGWYFQQFLKMAWAYKTKENRYLVWDSDTIPLNPLSFIENNNILFNQKTEYNQPYFETINTLFHGKITRKINGSFIAEHMVIDSGIMKRMLDEISFDINLKGESFWEKILYSVPETSLSHSGFSEFETYGNYALSVSDVYSPRILRTLRSGRVFLGTSPSKKQLDDASKYYDLVSIESPSQSFGLASKVMPWTTKFLRFCFIPFPIIVKVYIKMRKAYYRIVFHKTLFDIEGC